MCFACRGFFVLGWTPGTRCDDVDDVDVSVAASDVVWSVVDVLDSEEKGESHEMDDDQVFSSSNVDVR